MQVPAARRGPWRLVAKLSRPRAIAGALALSLLPTLHLTAQSAHRAPIFRFETDEFWLNLHHFLHVLGRAENQAPDAGRRAVQNAPRDVAQAQDQLSDGDRAVWRDAVTFYARGPSQRDLVFNRGLIALTSALGAADDAAALGGISADTAVARLLERAAPIYRAHWWPGHRAANVARRDEALESVARHGEAILTRITKAYGMSWPADGYPIHYAGYTNWAGAYSTFGDLLVVSSLDPGQRGALGLETLFHEAMHQWDDEMNQLLRGHAQILGVTVPERLSHALIFFTAGDATRRAVPGHVPYAVAEGVWDRGWGGLKQALDETWQPYLEGRGTRDEALAALVRRTGTPR